MADAFLPAVVEARRRSKRRHAQHAGGAGGHRRCRRSCRAALPRILRRHHPQQEHAHGLLPGRVPFFAWLEQHDIAELADIEPIHVAAYIEALADDGRQADSEAAPRGDPHAVRLARGRPGPRRQSGACGARAQACRAPRQDAGAHRGPGPAAARQHQGHEERSTCRTARKPKIPGWSACAIAR